MIECAIGLLYERPSLMMRRPVRSAGGGQLAAVGSRRRNLSALAGIVRPHQGFSEAVQQAVAQVRIRNLQLADAKLHEQCRYYRQPRRKYRPPLFAEPFDDAAAGMAMACNQLTRHFQQRLLPYD